jgi:hypothetical protein
MIGLINNELKRAWREAFIALFELLSRHFLEGFAGGGEI